jgi:hypothetical protein
MTVTYLELHHGHSDKHTLSLIFCSRCNFRRIGIYTEKCWGPLGDESYNYYEEACSNEAWEEINHLVSLCPDPQNPQCDCLAHTKLGEGLYEFLKSFKTEYKETDIDPDLEEDWYIW